MNKVLNIGIVGLGTVGCGVIKNIEKNSIFFENNHNVKINILGISAKNKSKDRPINIKSYDWYENPIDLAKNKNIDTILELVGGADGLAYDVALETLKQGKNFITANKALLSKHGSELAKLSEENKNFIGFEASVAGGIPVIKTLKESVRVKEIKKIYSILNGTSNYILSNMDNLNISFNDALKNAQEKGYAEADPTLDINGEDSAHKLSILNAIIFSEIPSVKSIHIKGIEGIELIDHSYASEFGYKIRLIAMSEIIKSKIYKEVSPMLVKSKSVLGRVDDANNVVQLINNESGDVVLEGKGAGEGPTSSSVISDLIDCSTDVRLKLFGDSFSNLTKNFDKIDSKKRPYYLRVFLKDQKGSMSKLTNLLSENNISIDKIIQKGESHLDDEKNSTPVVMITYPVRIEEINSFLEKIKLSELISLEPICVPVLEEG
jgi:homoserine dehydrogenase